MTPATNWQQLTSATDSNHTVYGKDFPEGTVCVTKDSIEILVKGVDFHDFYLFTGKTLLSFGAPLARGVFDTRGAIVLDAFIFIASHRMLQHVNEIINKWSEIRRAA